MYLDAVFVHQPVASPPRHVVASTNLQRVVDLHMEVTVGALDNRYSSDRLNHFNLRKTFLHISTGVWG